MSLEQEMSTFESQFAQAHNQVADLSQYDTRVMAHESTEQGQSTSSNISVSVLPKHVEGASSAASAY